MSRFTSTASRSMSASSGADIGGPDRHRPGLHRGYQPGLPGPAEDWLDVRQDFGPCLASAVPHHARFEIGPPEARHSVPRPDEAVRREHAARGPRRRRQRRPDGLSRLVHESGEEVRWDEDNEPATVNDQDLLGQAHLLASICLLTRYWPGDGARHDAALSIGGSSPGPVSPAPSIKYLAEAIARAAGDPKSRIARTPPRTPRSLLRRQARPRLPSLCKAFGDAVASRSPTVDPTAAHGVDDGADPIEPVDLWAKFDPPTLPRGLLPQLLEEFAFERSAVMGCDPTGLALGALAVCAASIPKTSKSSPSTMTRDGSKVPASGSGWSAASAR